MKKRENRKPRIVIGVTGSSGAVYALDFLKRYPHDKYLIMSKWGKAVMKDELKMSNPETALRPYYKKAFAYTDLTAPLASGTTELDAFVIIPATTSTIG